MKVIRCDRCGDEIEVLDKNNLSEYKEYPSKDLCPECKVQPDTAEEKILKAIFGEDYA